MRLTEEEIARIVHARCAQPHSLLGMHPVEINGDAGFVVRVFVDKAVECAVVDEATGERYSLEQIAAEGLFEGFVENQDSPFNYRVEAVCANKERWQFYDPYRFLPTISGDDLHLFSEGKDNLVYKKQGAHPQTIEGVPGVSFAVWAPNAQRVSVVGDFNNWDGRFHPMRSLGASGVWELFVPGVEVGTKYKYELTTQQDHTILKTDPYGTSFESPPNNASIVCDVDDYEWSDAAWMKKRQSIDWLAQPISVYELHLGSWRAKIEEGNRPLTYREAAHQLIRYVSDLGYTHVEFMPLSEHPFDGSWGYQVTGFFAPTYRFGPPEDFKYLVDQLHQAGIGVIMDWVPAHFPLDSFALAQFDGTALYEHADPRQGLHRDWGTCIFNYGRNEVKGFLIASALAWLDRYHIDGLRVDAVASMLYLDYSRPEGEWIPNQYGGRENLEAIDFIRAANDLAHHYHPGCLMIAEESTSFPGVTRSTDEGGLGFDLKWNMGWMHDTIDYFQTDPIHRKYRHQQLSFGMVYQYSENFSLVFSHDEVVHLKQSMIYKMFGEPIEHKANQLRALYAMMWMWPGKKTLFMGSDFGQTSEWNHNQSLDWHLCDYPVHEGILRLISDLNGLYRSSKAVAARDQCPDSFQWINCATAEENVLSFLRFGEAQAETLAAIGSFAPVHREQFRIGLPFGGVWKEVLNTDASEYNGGGFGNGGQVVAEEHPWDGRPFSAAVNLPPSSFIVLRYDG